MNPAPRADHTFVVPAYGHSPHLDACLASLRAQTSGSRIVLSTSTPLPEIGAAAARHDAEVFVHAPNRGIGHDWNMALARSRSDWTTIAHQDDLYHPAYAERLVAAGNRVTGTLLVFCDYAELHGTERRPDVALLRLKRVLLELGFLRRDAVASVAGKRRVLRFGSAIPCPAVTLHRNALRVLRFREDLRVNLDWMAWLELAARPGAFVWLRETLMEHRIHAGAQTTIGLLEGVREREDLAVLASIWPQPIAKMIVATYRGIYEAGR